MIFEIGTLFSNALAHCCNMMNLYQLFACGSFPEFVHLHQISIYFQVRPGMDLSRVVLPTFILEPRSFLEKLADYYYHADFLTE